MDAQRIKDATEELLLIARAVPKHKPALHRAVRLLEATLTKEDRPKALGRYGGRPMPSLAQPSQDPQCQSVLRL